MPELFCVDLFAGCGGLSLGLKQAGFNVGLAVERSPMAAETYYHNLVRRLVGSEEWHEYLKDSINFQFRTGLIVRPLRELLDTRELMSALQEREVDLLAGGPPCQGFSLAGSRNPGDERNRLAWEFLEFVDKVRPKAVLIENVQGMDHAYSGHSSVSTLFELRAALEKAGDGYAVQPMLLDAARFGVPQNRPRVMLVGIRQDLAKLHGLEVMHTAPKLSGGSVIDERARSAATIIPQSVCSRSLTVKDAIGDLDNRGYRSGRIREYAREMRSDLGCLAGWPQDHRQKFVGPANHELRKHSDAVIERFRLYQCLSEREVRLDILAIPKRFGGPRTLLRQELRDQLCEVTFPMVSPDSSVVARNLRELADKIIRLSTKKHSQRPLRWDCPAPTVMTLPDDFVHPDQPRTMTVREMARFQSFPDSFEFRGKVTTGGLKRRSEVPQYTQVGNAVPPRLARAVGTEIRNILASLRR